MMRLAVPFALLIAAAAAAGYWIGRGPEPGLGRTAIPGITAQRTRGLANGEPAASGQNREPSVSGMREGASAADEELAPARHFPQREMRGPEEQARAVPSDDSRLKVERAPAPRFMLPLAFLPEGADAAPVSLGTARELVPGAFGLALPAGIGGNAHGKGTSTSSAVAIMESTSEPLREESLARLRGQFEDTMRQPGLDPESDAYLDLWNRAQGVSDRQFAIWYGGDAAMRRQAAAYRLAAGHLRSGTSP